MADRKFRSVGRRIQGFSVSAHGNPDNQKRMMRAVGGRGVAVTITPVAANRDSRGLKQAASLARLGFRSVLFEGQKSSPPPHIADVEVIGLRGLAARQDSPEPSTISGVAAFIDRFRRRATSPQASKVLSGMGFLAYLIYYAAHFLFKGARHIPGASLYYLNEFSFFPAVWMKTWNRRSIMVYDARDFYSGMELPAMQTPFQRLIAGFGLRIERRCVRRADIFITVAEGVADLYQRDFGRRPEVIRNAHDTRIDRTPQKSLRERTGLSADAAIVVIVGQAKAGREISGVLGALARLPLLHLALVGNGYRQMLVGQTESIADRIHYVEDVPANEVVPLIREANASLIVYYARSENYKNALPNGFFQSVAAGLPLLHSGIPEIDRLCRDLDFGVSVQPDDVAGLTGWLEKVIDRGHWYIDQKLRSEKAALELTWQREEVKLDRLLTQRLSASGREDI